MDQSTHDPNHVAQKHEHMGACVLAEVCIAEEDECWGIRSQNYTQA